MGPFGGVPPSQLRVSDAERREVADLLARHFADGRLDQVELDERVGKAMAAKTRADLSGLLVDLPPVDGPGTPAPAVTPVPPPRPRRRLGAALVVLLLLLPAVNWIQGTLFWRHWWWPGAPGYGPFRPHLGVLLVVLATVFLWRRLVRRRRRAFPS